jgi:hypothetical protein
MGESGKSPLARLVLFMVCLALAGSMIAGIHYLTIDLPSQDSVKAPLNSERMDENCEVQYRACVLVCHRTMTTPVDQDDCYSSCRKDRNFCYQNPT